MSISGIFNAGVKGMAATQLATQVSANNISNAATVGYTRRTADIEPEQAIIGGVQSRRVIEPYIERRLLNARSSSGEAQVTGGGEPQVIGDGEPQVAGEGDAEAEG